MAVTDLSLSVSPLHDEDHISSGLSLRPVEAALEDPAVRRRRFSVSVVAVLAALAVVAGTVAVVVLRDDSVGRVPNSPMDMNPKKTGGVANTNVALLANADGKVDTRLAGYCGQDAQCTILNTVCVEGSCYCPEGFYAVLTGEREELEDVECQEGETYYYAEETAEETDEPTLGTNLSPDDLAALIADTGSYAPLDPAPPPNVVEADAQKNFYQYYDDDETSNLYTTGLEAVTDAFPPEVLAGEMNMERAPTDENDEGVEGLITGDHMGIHLSSATATTMQNDGKGVKAIPIVAATLADLSMRPDTAPEYSSYSDALHPNYHFLALAKGRTPGSGTSPVVSPASMQPTDRFADYWAPSVLPTAAPTATPTMPTMAPTESVEETKTHSVVSHVLHTDEGGAQIDSQTITMEDGNSIDMEIAKKKDGTIVTTKYIDVGVSTVPTAAPTEVPTEAPTELPTITYEELGEEEDEEAAEEDEEAAEEEGEGDGDGAGAGAGDGANDHNEDDYNDR